MTFGGSRPRRKFQDASPRSNCDEAQYEISRQCYIKATSRSPGLMQGFVLNRDIYQDLRTLVLDGEVDGPRSRLCCAIEKSLRRN